MKSRFEEVIFHMKFDKEHVAQYESEIKFIGEGVPDDITTGAPTVSLDYKFSIEYFSDCIEKLLIIKKLFADHSLTKSVDVEELKHGECLAKILFDQIHEINAMAGSTG